MENLKVLHIITGLGNGGAEGVLVRLCTHDKSAEHIVIALIKGGVHTITLRNSGISVYELDMKQTPWDPRNLIKLEKILLKEKPEIVQTWLYHADFLGGIFSKLNGIPVVWGIRHANFLPGSRLSPTKLIAKSCAWMSDWIPSQIVANGNVAEQVHIQMGYNSSKMVVIPNGYDTNLLFPDKAKRKKLRNELGVATDIPVLGMVARYHPQKGHSVLLNALGILRDRGGRFKCVLVGPGMNVDNKELCAIIDDLKLSDFLSLMDERADVSLVMNGLDLHVLSSLCEAFPNVVAEAMACGTPCVVTDVGDAAFIVGPSGWVVPASDSQSLANAIESALDEMREQPERWKQRQSAASTRILENYSLESMIAKFHDVWEKSVRR